MRVSAKAFSELTISHLKELLQARLLCVELDITVKCAVRRMKCRAGEHLHKFGNHVAARDSWHYVRIHAATKSRRHYAGTPSQFLV